MFHLFKTQIHLICNIFSRLVCMCSLFACAPLGHSASRTVRPHNVSLSVWKCKIKRLKFQMSKYAPVLSAMHWGKEHAIIFNKEWWISDLVPRSITSTSPPSSSCLSELFTAVWVCFLQVVTAGRLLITLIRRRITHIVIEETWGKHPPRVQKNLVLLSGKTLII